MSIICILCSGAMMINFALAIILVLLTSSFEQITSKKSKLFPKRNTEMINSRALLTEPPEAIIEPELSVESWMLTCWY